MKRLITGLVLSGLALFSFAWYPPHASSTRTETTVRVKWLPDFETVDLVCSFIDKTKPKGNILACYLEQNHTIYAVQPESFNDTAHLAILGHEFWHALGAEHPNIR